MSNKRWEEYDEIVCMDGHVINMKKLLKDQEIAKASICHIQPFFKPFINKLKMVYTFRVNTQATDGKTIFVNPRFTEGLDLTQKAFVMAHEIMHVILNHLRREKRAGFEHHKANCAADYECNIALADLGLISISSIKKVTELIDEKYRNMGFEEIYNVMPEPKKENNKPDPDKQQGDGEQEPVKIDADPDYIKGWNKAIEDYKNGKLKL
jgi:predicted metal-dependent peptidase